MYAHTLDREHTGRLAAGVVSKYQRIDLRKPAGNVKQGAPDLVDCGWSSFRTDPPRPALWKCDTRRRFLVESSQRK
jgi:hypothetical protein